MYWRTTLQCEELWRYGRCTIRLDHGLAQLLTGNRMTKIVLDMNRHGILSRGGSIRQSEITDKDRAVNGGIEDISRAAVPGNRFTDIYSCSVWL